MPLTSLELPILAQFLCIVASTTGEFPLPMKTSQQPEGAAASANTTTPNDDRPVDAAPLPKGMVLGPDGKPCRSCTSAATWKAMMSRATTSGTPSSSSPSSPSPSSPFPTATTNCPPDVETLGRSTWTLLHTIAAQYPARATAAQQADTRQFLGLFGQLYPCWVCAADFRAWSAEHAPRTGGREELGRWMCEAHNAVNAKLGKARFDCGRWEERWRTGWRDGSCD